MNNEIEDKLKREIALISGREPGDINPEQPLHVMGIDSMSFVEVLVFIENEFGLKLVETGLTRDDFDCVRSLANRIQQELNQARS